MIRCSLHALYIDPKLVRVGGTDRPSQSTLCRLHVHLEVQNLTTTTKYCIDDTTNEHEAHKMTAVIGMTPSDFYRTAVRHSAQKAKLSVTCFIKCLNATQWISNGWPMPDTSTCSYCRTTEKHATYPRCIPHASRGKSALRPAPPPSPVNVP